MHIKAARKMLVKSTSGVLQCSGADQLSQLRYGEHQGQVPKAAILR